MEVKAYLAVLRRRAWILIVATLICVAVVAYGFDKIPPVYEASTSLRVLTPIEGGATYVQFQIYYGNRLANTYVQMASSNAVMEEMQKRLGLSEPPKVKVEAIPDSEIVKITAQAADPVTAVKIANTLAEIVTTQSINPYMASTETAPQVLESRLATLETEYTKARANADALVKPYSDISAQITVLTRTINQKEQNYQDLRRQYEDAQVQQAVEVYAGLKARQQAIQDLVSQKLTTLGAELDKDKAQLETLTAQQTEFLQQLNTAQREADTKESNYNSMRNQVDLARIAENIRTNSTGTLVVDTAELPTDPIGLSRWMALVLGALVGLAAGVVMAFIVESMDNTIYSAEEVEAITGAPTLGTVPSVRIRSLDKLDLLGSFGDNPPLRESFRSIAATLLLQTRSNATNIIMVTSAEPMEGKSLFTAYLGLALAQSRRKVVVVDGDMRLSQQHLMFHVANTQGLSDVLAETTPLSEAVQPTQIANVSLLPGGTEYANPVELLVGPLLPEVMKELAARYDYVLVDSPSFLAVADSELLAEVSQGVIMVTRRKESSKDAIRNTVRMLKDAHAKLLGVVVNSVKPKPRYAYYNRSRGGRVLRPDTDHEQKPPLVEGNISS